MQWGSGIGHHLNPVPYQIEQIENLDKDEELSSECITNEKICKIKIKRSKIKIHRQSNTDSKCKIFDLNINGDEGSCILTSENMDVEFKQHYLQNQFRMETVKSTKLVVPFIDEGKNEDISGGKGSSLVNLIQMKKELNLDCEIPNGIIVTTNAYKLLMEENEELVKRIDLLQKLAWLVPLNKKKMI